MIPSLAAAEFANVLRDYIVSLCDLGVGKSLIAKVQDFYNLILRELGIPVIATPWGCITRTQSGGASFARSIAHIVGLSSAKKVIGTDTGWVVTVVTDVLPGGNRAIMQFIAKAMGKLDFVIANVELAVTKLHLASSPQPTRSPKNRMDWTVLINHRPKAFHDGHTTVVTVDKTDRLSFGVTAFGAIRFRNWRESATSTLAIAKEDFLAWITGRGCEQRELWSIIGVHPKPQLSVSNPGTC